MDENVKLYGHWIFCIKEKCDNFGYGCSGSHDNRCKEQTFIPLADLDPGKLAALEKNDSPPDTADVLF
jgi:hypothetical protein